MDLPLGRADYHRSVAREARIQTVNRYYETNPVLTEGGVAMISRPALARGILVGDGPVRGTYTSPGSFDDALFAVSDNEWWRINLDLTQLSLTGAINPGSSISMAATGNIGTTPEYLFLADGRNLWLYIEDGYAHGTISGSPADGDTVVIGSYTYQFTTGSVDAGTPDGSAVHPWLVAKSLTDASSWAALGYAVGATGTGGTDYSTVLAANPDAETVSADATAVTVRALAVGMLGNDTVTTETGAGIAWSSATLEGGGTMSVTTVDTPDDIGAISVAFIAGYIVVIPAQGNGINGRFWWIEPGETTIDPLNFATAERAPDPVFAVVVFGDQFWLPGESTTEVWFFTGESTAPVSRVQGVTFDRGTWEGTALQVKESMIIVDSDGGVFQIGGQLDRISNPSIEQRIREAIEYQASH